MRLYDNELRFETDTLAGMYIEFGTGEVCRITSNEGDTITFRNLSRWERLKHWWMKVKRWIRKGLSND